MLCYAIPGYLRVQLVSGRVRVDHHTTTNQANQPSPASPREAKGGRGGGLPSPVRAGGAAPACVTPNPLRIAVVPREVWRKGRERKEEQQRAVPPGRGGRAREPVWGYIGCRCHVFFGGFHVLFLFLTCAGRGQPVGECVRAGDLAGRGNVGREGEG